MCAFLAEHAYVLGGGGWLNFEGIAGFELVKK